MKNSIDMIKAVYTHKNMRFLVSDVREELELAWPNATAAQLSGSVGGAIASNFLIRDGKYLVSTR